jgi:hypothetical protein
MAASGSVKVVMQLLGLGQEQSFSDRFTLSNVPTTKVMDYRQQAVADTEEVLDIGSVSTIDAVIIKAILNDMTVDPSFDTSYRAGITIPQGEFAVFKPTGTVKIKNLDGGEQATYEYFIIGR